MIAGKRFRSAWGNNKKEAEQLAAYNALCELGVIKESEQ
jgi:dsRNA-specific ribonuclease